MKVLTKDRWHLFHEDGKLFELLVEELLNAEYPNANFKHTSWTRDGGKDFEGSFSLFDSTLKTWAECKYHKDSLPIQDVSMTLFMAYIESAHVILFFSYSPVNSEFEKYIFLYKNKSNKEIKIYDDLALEELILKNKEKIDFKKYFGDFFTDEIVETNDITYKYWVHSNKQSKSLHINELVKVEFCATNHSSKPKNIEIKIRHSNSSKCFQIINSSTNIGEDYQMITIPPNSVSGVSIDLKLHEFSNNLKYPYIIVKEDEDIIDLTIKKQVNCLWLAETPLLGQENILYLKNISQFLDSEKGKIGMIIGGSGTGKSRLINEIAIASITMRYKMISFDVDSISHLSAERFFKKLIGEIEDIPELTHITKTDIKKKYYSKTRNDSYTNFAMKLLFENNLQFDELKEKLVDYLLFSLSRKNYIIVLDNIQFYDENILMIFQDIIERHNELTSSFILLSANTDYIYEDTICDKISHQMELMESRIPYQFTYKRMKNFTPTDAFDYLQKCLNGDSNSDIEVFKYEKTLKKIIDIYGTNPFFLQNYMMYLNQEGIIKRTDYSAYYIENINKLQESFSRIPHKIHNLLAMREERFISDVITTDELLDQYILFVSYLSFAKWIPFQMIKELVDIPQNIMHEMKRVGLIKVNDDGEYGFYHQQIEEYYKSKYPYKQQTSSALERFCIVAQKQINKKTYIECIFLAQYLLNKINDDIWNKLITRICTNNIDYRKTYDICIATSNILENYPQKVSPVKYIKIYNHMTNLVTSRNGILDAHLLYKRVYVRFCHVPQFFNNVLVDLIGMMKTYILNGLHLNHAHDSLEICTNTILLLKNHFADYTEYNNLLLNIYEGKIFVYNKLQDLEMSLKAGEILIDLAKSSDNIINQVRAQFIKGDIYYSNYYAYKYIKETCTCWHEAFKIYNDNAIEHNAHDYFSQALFFNVYMREIMTNLMEQNHEEAIKHMSTIQAYIGRTKMNYFEIKLRHLYVCVRLYTQNSLGKLLCEYEKLYSYIIESIDICAVYGSQTLYLDCFHLLAILQRICGKSNWSIDNYSKSYSILRLLLENQENATQWTYFILDLVIAMRELNCKNKIPPHIWRLLNNEPDAEDTIKKIYKAKKDELEDLLRTSQYKSPLYCDIRFINFPKI